MALDPFFATYYAVPVFIFYPVMIAIFGLSLIPIVLMGVATAIVAMIIATLNGLDRIPRVLTKVARVHRMGRLSTALRLQLPAAAPYLFTGVKLSVSYAFIAVIAAEFILAPAGLGRDIANAYADFDNRRMYALMLFVLVIATVVNAGLHAWDLRWAKRRGGGRHDRNAARRSTRWSSLSPSCCSGRVWRNGSATPRCPARLPTFVYLAHFVPTARFAENAAATAIAFALALLLAYGLGLAIGVWMGAHRLSGEVGEPILITLYSLPKITLYPVILLIFGLTLSGKVVFGAIHGVLPVALLTMAAIRNIPMVYLKSARTLQLSPWQTIWNVLLPATIPEVLAGLRIGFTVTLLGVLLGRNVRLEGWPGLPHHQCDDAAANQGDDHHRGGAVRFRRGRQCDPVVDRAPAASAGLAFRVTQRAGVILQFLAAGVVAVGRIGADRQG